MQERFQLEGNAAAIYEAQKVPSIFTPLAAATLSKVQVRPQDHVIDLACGTGAVTRLLAKALQPPKRIVGVDLNAGMIDVARAIADDMAIAVEWFVGDAIALPFADGEYDLAICQQGLQFFPDKTAALSEIQRVLVSGGRLVVSVWKEASPLFVAMADALRKHIGLDAAERSLAPFSFGDADLIASLLAGAGFQDIGVETMTIDRVLGPAQQSIPLEIDGSPIAPDVAAAGDSAKVHVITDTEAALAPYRRGDGFVIPQRTFLAQAVVP